MNGLSSVEFDHCRELALRPGSIFEFTYQYLSPGSLEQYLAFYALKQNICTIPFGHVDDAVKWEKLKWWSEELLADPDSQSRHPVVRALKTSGARAKLENNQLLRLISGALMQIDAAPDSDTNTMFERFSELGAAEIELELLLEDASIDKSSLSSLAAASTLAELIFSFAPGQRSQIERLPLELLAKYSVNSSDLESGQHPEEFAQIVALLASLNLDWYREGLSGLVLSGDGSIDEAPAAHLRLRWALEQRQLMSISKGGEKYLDAGQQFGPADAWFAWRFLRKLK